MTDELKPCPFCGGSGAGYMDDVQYPDTPNERVWYAVTCGKCDANGAWDLGKNGAVEKWNTRRLEDALRVELAQQAELHRMEREALIGAWNETSRQLRARIAEVATRSELADQLEQARARIAELEAARDEARTIAKTALHELGRVSVLSGSTFDPVKPQNIAGDLEAYIDSFHRTYQQRIAELEARLTPVKFSEREPEEAGRYQVVPANSWLWTVTYWNPESVEIREYVLREYAYWLPMPPAPEDV